MKRLCVDIVMEKDFTGLGRLVQNPMPVPKMPLEIGSRTSKGNEQIDEGIVY